jgi:hypothetical protein
MSVSERPRLGGRRQDSASSRLSGPPLELQISGSSIRSTVSSKGTGKASLKLVGLARHTLGLVLLLLVVFLWTGSNFMGSVRRLFPVLHNLAIDQPFRVSSRIVHMLNRSS